MADIDLNKIVPARALEGIRTAGLHKIAAAMVGLDEIGLKEAAALIGARAYVRRKEAATVLEGIASLAELRGEKVANWQELLHRAFLPAVAGAGLAMVPDLMAEGPMDTDKAMQHALVGGALGGAGSVGHNLFRASQRNAPAFEALVGSLPR